MMLSTISYAYLLSIFFGEMSVQVFCPFLIGLFVSLSFSLKSTLYILNNSPLSDRSFANSFSQSVAYLLILLKLYFTEQVFNFFFTIFSFFNCLIPDILFLNFFYWNIVHLQYCLSFGCTTK